MIYLDHNATTPVAREVLDAMRPYLDEAHALGAVRLSVGYDNTAAEIDAAAAALAGAWTS